MVAGDVPGGDVAVTARDGTIEKSGAPSGLFSDLVKQIGQAIKDVGNLVNPPLVLHANAYASMTIVFGGLPEDEDQTKLPYHAVWRTSNKIGRLISLEGDELFTYALQVGAGAKSYVELTKLVQSEGIQLDWEVRGMSPQVLTVERAASQYQRLTAPAEIRERTMQVQGLLYRVIYEGQGSGRVGIRLAKGSPVPPRVKRSAILRYQDAEIEDQVIHNLIGQPVRATLLISEYAPQASLSESDLPRPLIQSIEAIAHPVELFDAEDDDDDFDD